MRVRYLQVLALACALASALGSGCGQTGPLRLPDEGGEVVSSGPATATAPADPETETEATRKPAAK